MKLLFLVLAITVISCGATSNLKNYLDMGMGMGLGIYSYQGEDSLGSEPVAPEPPVYEAPVAPTAEVGEPVYIADEPVAPEPPVYEAPVAPTAEVGEPVYIADEPVAPEPPVYEAPVAPTAEVGEPVYIVDEPVAPEPPVYEAPVAPTAEVGEPVYIADEPVYNEAPLESVGEPTYFEEPVEAEPTFGERLDEQIFTTTAAPGETDLANQPDVQALNDRANDPQVRASIDLGIQALLDEARARNGVPADVGYTFESLDNLVDLNNSHQFTVTLSDGADRRAYLTFTVVEENGQSRVTNGCVKAGKFVRV